MRDLVHFGISADTDWMDHAACVGQSPSLFFPPPGRQTFEDAAVEICQRCPVRDHCLDFALDTHQDHGVWGGYNAAQRRRIRRQRRRDL